MDKHITESEQELLQQLENAQERKQETVIAKLKLIYREKALTHIRKKQERFGFPLNAFQLDELIDKLEASVEISARSFVPSKGVFSSWVKRKWNQKIWDYVKKQKKIHADKNGNIIQVVSENVHNSDGGNFSLIEISGNKGASIDQRQSEKVQDWLTDLVDESQYQINDFESLLKSFEGERRVMGTRFLLKQLNRKKSNRSKVVPLLSTSVLQRRKVIKIFG